MVKSWSRGANTKLTFSPRIFCPAGLLVEESGTGGRLRCSLVRLLGWDDGAQKKRKSETPLMLLA